MNGAQLQERIYAGYAKAAKHTGRPYSVYRSATPIEPLDTANVIGQVDCLFAAEKKFEVPQKYKIPTRYLYADGRLLQQRDILVGPYGTFYIGDMQPNLPIQAIWCNDEVSIGRTAYVGAVVGQTPVATAMPAFRQLKKVDQKPVSAIGGASTAATPIGEWFLYLPVDPEVLHQGDIVTDRIGRIYTLDTIDPTEIGAVVTMRQADAAPR